MAIDLTTYSIGDPISYYDRQDTTNKRVDGTFAGIVADGSAIVNVAATVRISNVIPRGK